MNFSLARIYTGQKQNQLELAIGDPDQFTFTLTGTGFNSDTPRNQALPLKKLVNLSYQQEGTYFLTLKITRKDGVNFINKQLQWTYSTETPPKLEAAFEETGTSSGLVHVLFPPTINPDINQVWVEGDLLTNPKGQWYSMPSSLSLPLTVSKPDGEKTITMKYQNIYGNVGPASSLSIIKKSIGPKNCQAVPISNRSYTANVEVYLAATNQGPMFYKFSGDVDATSWVSFNSQVDATVDINAGNGLKNVIVSMQDIAGNRCPDIPFQVTVDNSYPPYDITVQGNILWTDNLGITVIPRFDHLPNDQIEMFLSGNIQDSSVTGTWLPLASEVAIQLTPVNGNRFVYAQYRSSNGQLSDRAYVSIYLKPFISAQAAQGGTWTLTPSHFTSLTSMTISGCQENYLNIGYQATLVCTPTGDSVTANYLLTDQSIVSRSVNLQ